MNKFNSALYNGDIKTAEELLSKGADIHSPDELGIWPLQSAINSSFPESLDFLVKKGININQQFQNGWTALHLIIDLCIDGMIQNRWDQPDKKNLKLLEILLDNRASLHNKTSTGEKPLDLLNSYAASENSFNLLKEFFRPVIPGIDELVAYKNA